MNVIVCLMIILYFCNDSNRCLPTRRAESMILVLKIAFYRISYEAVLTSLERTEFYCKEKTTQVLNASYSHHLHCTNMV